MSLRSLRACVTSLALAVGVTAVFGQESKTGKAGGGFFGERGSPAAAKGTPAVSAETAGALIKRLPKLDELLGPPTGTEGLWSYLEQDFKFGYDADIPIHLERLLAQPDLAERLADLREERGSSLVFDVIARPELGDNGAKFIKLANDAMEKRLGDLERIKRMLGNLGKSESERIFAIQMLQRSGRRAMPSWLAEWRSADASARERLADVLQRMPSECVPAMLAMTADKDQDLVLAALAGLSRVGDKSHGPALLELTAAKGTPDKVRNAARATLRQLTGSEPSPAEATAELVAVSDRLRFAARDHHERETALVATIEGSELKYETVPATQRDRQLAQEYADAALRLDPARASALLARLAIALDQPFASPVPELPAGPTDSVKKGLDADPTLLSRLLTRSLSARENAVAYHALRIIRVTRNGTALDFARDRPSPLRQALASPDPRIRSQAAFAALELAGKSQRVDVADRTVETLTAELSRYNRPTIVVIDGMPARGNQTVSWLLRAGFDATLAASGRDGFNLAAGNPTVIAVVLEPGFGDWPAEETIRNFGGDERTAGLPLLVMEELEENEQIRLAVASVPGARMLSPDTSIGNLAEIFDETIVGDPGNRLPRMRKVKELNFNAKSPLTLIVDGDPERAAVTARWIGDAKQVTRTLKTGRAVFDFIGTKANLGLTDAIVFEADIKDWGLVETMNAIRLRPEGRDVPMFIIDRQVPGNRWDWLIARSSRCRKLVRAVDSGIVHRLLEREFGIIAAESVNESARIAERSEALGWVGRLIAGEKPQFNPRPAIEALSVLLGDPTDGPKAATALGGLPSAANQRRLAEVLISSTQPVGNRVAAALALENNFRKSSVGLNGLGRKRVADAWRSAKRSDLRAAFSRPALLTGELSRGELAEARQLATREIKLGTGDEATEDARTDGSKPGPKPVAPKGPKAVQPKAAEKKSRGFFDD
jgi:CheY-like chemotaxis protein